MTFQVILPIANLLHITPCTSVQLPTCVLVGNAKVTQIHTLQASDVV